MFGVCRAEEDAEGPRREATKVSISLRDEAEGPPVVDC